MKSKQFYQLIIILLLLNAASAAQQNKVQLLNSETNQTVSDVHYTYGSNSGISNLRGEILIEYKEGISLYLSHLQFGKQEIKPGEVKNAIEKGSLEIRAASHHLMPVTFLRIHNDAGQKSRLDIAVQQKLEHDAGKLLDGLASFSVIRKSGSYGFDPVLHGFKYDQLNLVIDGTQTASAACPNRMDPASSQIPINMISSVEVIKGPYSLRYGPAFGGTINFISSQSTFSEKPKPLGRLGTSYESNGKVWRTEGVAGISGKKTDLQFFGSYSTGNDYKDGDDFTVQADFNRLNWGGKFGLKINEKQKLGILLSNNRAKDVDFPALPMDLRDDNTWLINASHSAIFYDKNISTWKSTLYYSKVNHLMDNFDKIIDPRNVDASTLAETTNYGGRTESRFDVKSGYLFSGIDYRFEGADGERTRNILMGPMTGKTIYDNVWQDAQIQRGGIFAEYHFDKPDFHVVFSGRLDYNSAKSNNPDPNFSSLYPKLSSEFLNPSFSAGATKVFQQKFSLGLWLGTAQRSPGVAERYINFFPIGLDPYEMLGNPQLKPETNNQADLIFGFKTPFTNINLDFYSSILKNYISSEIEPDIKPKMPTSPGVRRFVNIDNALIAGFEFNWEQTFTTFLKHNLSIVYTSGENKITDEPLPEIPPFEIKYRLLGSFAKEKVRPEILFRQALKQDRIAVSYGETATPGFNVVDTKVSWLITNAITAAGGILNLFDTAYYEHLSRSVRGSENRPIYSPGRSFFVTITFNLM